MIFYMLIDVIPISELLYRSVQIALIPQDSMFVMQITLISALLGSLSKTQLIGFHGSAQWLG